MKTIPIRIAVAVDSEGAWSSAGWCLAGKPESDKFLECQAQSPLEGRTAVHFVTAEIPLPESNEVAGKVEEPC